MPGPVEKRLREQASTDSEGAEEVVTMEGLDRKLNAMIERMGEMFGEVKVVSKNVKDIQERVEKHEAMIGDLGEKVDRTREEMKGIKEKVDRSAEEMERVQESVKEMRKEMDEWRERMNMLESRVIDQEARGRRNNLILHGIEEGEREDCMLLVKEVLKEKFKMKGDVKVERAHRLGKKGKGPNMQGYNTA